MLGNNDIYFYTEYCNDVEIATITFGEPEYIYVIKVSSQKVYTFAGLYNEMKKVYVGITEGRLRDILINLKQSYLIYCNTAFSNIVSVIELKG